MQRFGCPRGQGYRRSETGEASPDITYHEEANLEILLVGQLRSIVIRPKEAFLLGGPPRKPNAIVHTKLGKLGGNFDQ